MSSKKHSQHQNIQENHQQTKHTAATGTSNNKNRHIDVSYLRVDDPPNYKIQQHYSPVPPGSPLFNGGQSLQTNVVVDVNEVATPQWKYKSSGSAPPRISSANRSINTQRVCKRTSSGTLLPHLLTVEFETENSNRITYFVMSCLVATFINPLFGFAAICFSLKSHNLFMTRTTVGRKQAHFYGRLAFIVNVLGIVLTMLALIIVFFYMGENSFEDRNERDTGDDLKLKLLTTVPPLESRMPPENSVVRRSLR